MQSKIFYVDVYLNTEIHAQALGFTKNFMAYAYAKTPEEAEAVVTKWAKHRQMDVKKVRAAPAVNQNPSTYTFPHQIINLPADILAKEYDRRNYPDCYRDPGVRIAL